MLWFGNHLDLSPGGAAVNRRTFGGVLAVVLVAVLSCGGDAAPESGESAMTWRRIDDGWAWAVALDPPFVLEGVRGGDALDAVVLPAGAGVLVVESRAGVERVAVERASRVVVPLARGGPATLRFEGAEAVLHAPRLVPVGRTVTNAEAPTGAADTAREAAPRRILLVVIDTLRADAVTPETMPELLASFADGARFTRAYSAATWTLPSMASLFTGRAPTELALPDGALIALAPDERTLATDLAARGYHGVGISANYTVHHENGFSSGFELFLVPEVLGHGDWPDAEWVLDRARRALEWFPDRDLFLYLHLMDPHDPYRNHETGEALAAPSTGATVAASEVDAMRVAYASEARRVSVLLADFLRDAGPFDRVVVTADHGEEFLEHGGFKHGPTVYPEVSRVPLLVRGGLAPGVVEAPVSLLELRRFLGAGDDRRGGIEPGDDVDVVSFVHAAPRFAWVHDEGQAVLFARDLAPVGSGATSQVDPIGDWLRAHHPAIDFVDPYGAPRAPIEGEPLSAALRLGQRFHRLRAGRWILVPAATPSLRVELAGTEAGGWWWGAAARVALGPATAAGGGAAPSQRRDVLTVEGVDPFVLLFVPDAGAGIDVSSGGSAALEEIEGPPTAGTVRGAVTWRDPGRPAAALGGVEETLRRLRAQGYL